MPIISEGLTQRLKDRLPLIRDLRKTALAMQSVRQQVIEQRKNRRCDMPVSIDDVYKNAFNKVVIDDSAWRKAFLLTELIDIKGDVIKPDSDSHRDVLAYKIETLKPYLNDPYVYEVVGNAMAALKK